MWVCWLGTSVFHQGWKHHAAKKQPSYFSDEGWFFFFRTCSPCEQTAVVQKWHHLGDIDNDGWRLHYISLLVPRCKLLKQGFAFSAEARAELSHLKYVVNQRRYTSDFSSRRQNSVCPHFSGVGPPKTFRISVKTLLLIHFCPHTWWLVWRVLIQTFHICLFHIFVSFVSFCTGCVKAFESVDLHAIVNPAFEKHKKVGSCSQHSHDLCYLQKKILTISKRDKA